MSEITPSTPESVPKISAGVSGEEKSSSIRGEPRRVNDENHRPASTPRYAPTIRCGFCGGDANEKRTFISGPHVYICNQCVVLCNEILAEAGEHPEVRCERCKQRNAWSWHAPSPLWNAVMRNRVTGEDRYSIVCPPCFAELATVLIGETTWCFKPHDVDVSALWADSDGRQWNAEQCLWVDRELAVDRSRSTPNHPTGTNTDVR